MPILVGMGRETGISHDWIESDRSDNVGTREAECPSNGESDPRLDAAIVEAAKSHERYRLLFEQSPVGVLTYDRDLVITDLNHRLEEILQSSRQSLLGLDMKRLRDQNVVPAMRAALAGETGEYEGEYRATTSQAQLWISLRAVALRDPISSRITGGVGIVEDVTERHEVEKVQSAVYEISEAVHATADLQALYRRIHQIIDRLMPAENLYIALWNADTELIRFPYFVDVVDPPPDPQKTSAGMTDHVLRSGEPLLMSREDIEERIDAGVFRVQGAIPAFWLGVPLRTKSGTIGALALQSYDESVRLDSAHRRMIGFVADQIATAIERKRHETQIQRMAYFDSLTDLYNRRMLHEQAGHLLAQAARRGREAALLYLDLDRFKHVNDTLGHDAGDDLLVDISADLRSFVRQSDLLARLGGDEFAVLLPEACRMEAARSAGRLLENLDRTYELRGRDVHVGASVGIALYPDDGNDLETLLKHADIAMYHAKERGGGFAFFEAASSPYSLGRLELEARLRKAVENDALRVLYQPLVDPSDGSIHCVEALERWTDERGRSIPAGEFVPVAEDSRLVVQLDRRVLLRALTDLSALPTNARPRLAVNLSARSLHDRDLVNGIRSSLEASGISPQMLVVEVTESTAIHDLQMSSRALDSLRALGISVALDDFGAGYASITHLRALPCDRLKIALELTAEIGRSRRGESLLETAIQLGHALDLEVVAEGVELPEQLDWLRERGCDLVQGFLVGRPAPLEA
ncbi:MAG: EAL domain-containing protein [Thermoanaerobaculia bacterium]|nr:EAL domain-containing protein [Thermoanaerobaculia bacterium]